jgi:hypothetical protein
MNRWSLPGIKLKFKIVSFVMFFIPVIELSASRFNVVLFCQEQLIKYAKFISLFLV